MPTKEISVDEIYEKDRNLKKEDVKALMDWMEKQPHLPKATELQITLFLNSCYYSNEAAKSTIDTYFTLRTMFPDLFTGRTFKDRSFKITAKSHSISLLPRLTSSGDTVLISRLVDRNLDNFYPTQQIKLIDTVIMLYLHQYGPMQGFQLIFDMELSSLGNIIKLSPTVVKNFLYYLQEGMPVRIKRIHFINIPSFMDRILALIKPFMKKELFELLEFHTEMETLYKYVPQEILPEEYGGSCDSLLKLLDKVNKNIEESEDFLKFQENQLVDESKRQGPSKYVENLFGVDGSFKRLEID